MPPATDSPTGPSADLIGKTIKGRYRVVRLLGRGAMGNVYEVLHERLRSSFALKQLRADLANEPEIVSRFRHEAEIMARLSHPNVARVFDIDAEPEVGSWMAMELVHGEDLGAVMRRTGRLPLGEAVRIGFQIATALDCAHKAGLVHRDIKPANVLIEAGTLRAVLTDFGIAKSRVPDEADAATRTGVFLGTYRYSSPEQLRNLRGVAIDARADVYSLGVVLYEMVSGNKFLAGLSESDVLSEVGFNAAWRPTLTYDEPPPVELVDLIAHCLAPDRDQRIPSAGVVAEKLAAIAAALPASDGALPPLVVLPRNAGDAAAPSLAAE
ncbi:serine/threonine protein kinase, partial [Candidatus Binatia bacterium]|nr:serine/threonine protein kinase [Candidatus Binatia bacterium]